MSEQPRMTEAVARGDRWAAGSEGEAFPVQAGEIWAIGRHLLVCSDFMGSTLFDEVLTGQPELSLVYCDPPWGQGLVNSFRTKAGLAHATYRWEQLYRRVAQLGHVRHLPVFMEGSVIESRDGAKIFSTMQHPLEGGRRNWYWAIEYASHSPAGLYYSALAPPPQRLIDSLTGMHDKNTPGAVMAAYGATGTVIEPCCGLGGTPLNAEKAGWGSVNNEMNPFRMSAALFRLEKVTGLKAARIG